MEKRQGFQEKGIKKQNPNPMWLVDIQEQQQVHLKDATEQFRAISIRR